MQKKRKKRERVRDRWHIALYVPRDIVKPLRAEANKRERAYSTTVVEILRQYFDAKAVEARIARRIEQGIDEAETPAPAPQHDSHV